MQMSSARIDIIVYSATLQRGVLPQNDGFVPLDIGQTFAGAHEYSSHTSSSEAIST